MLKLPIIMPGSILGTQQNHDVEKQSFLGKPVNYSNKIFVKFTEMLDQGRLNVLKIDEYQASRLKSLGKELGLKNVKDKSGELVRNEIKNMSNRFMAGQGPCHGYKSQRGRTGGFTDVFCDHMFKVGSKVQPVQATVRYRMLYCHSPANPKPGWV